MANQNNVLKTLKAEADTLGVEYGRNIGETLLRTRIAEAKNTLTGANLEKTAVELAAEAAQSPSELTDSDVEAQKPIDTETVTEAVVVKDTAKAVKMKETAEQARKRMYLAQMKLRRVIIRCNNDMKANWDCQDISAANNLVGRVHRVIPFDNEAGWHVEQILLDTLNDKVCQKFKEVKLPNGVSHSQAYTVKEFTIEMLPDLKPAEIKKLAAAQKARASIDE